MMKDICSLPNYAALEKLASALWQHESAYHGAAKQDSLPEVRFALDTDE